MFPCFLCNCLIHTFEGKQCWSLANLKLFRFVFRHKELSAFSDSKVGQTSWFNSYRTDYPQEQQGLWFVLGFWTQFRNSLPRLISFLFLTWTSQSFPSLLNSSSLFSNTNLTFSYKFYSTLINIHHYLGKILYSYNMLGTSHVNEISDN